MADGSPPCWTASTSSASSPTNSSNSCPPHPESAPPGLGVDRPGTSSSCSQGLALQAVLALDRGIYHQGPRRHGPDRGPAAPRLHRPPGRLRPAQAARQTPDRQTRSRAGATTFQRRPPAPSPPYSPSADQVIAPSPVSTAHDGDSNPRSGTRSTATTNNSAPTCTSCSPTSASPPGQPHRLQIVDQDFVNA